MRIVLCLLLAYPLYASDPVRDPIVPPRLIKKVEPKYPEEARRTRVSGVVILELTIERDGRVSGGRVLKPLPFGLTKAAIDAVEKWRYKPAEDPRGRVVRAIHVVRVKFTPPS